MISGLAQLGIALALAASASLLLLHGPDRRNVDPAALPSLVIPAYTTHARFLPAPSKHAFSYPLLYLGVDVDSLETSRLNLPLRLLQYGGSPWSKILGLRSRGYLRAGDDGLRHKLEKLLQEHGIAAESIGRTWLVTMPSYMGLEGINPLSVWYVYGNGEKAGLLAVVLEVHNTFGEKHAYVLKSDSITKHAEPSKQYDHTWTFPRSFHVSPFNSRNGFYQLDIVDPFPATRLDDHVPELRVFLRLLTPEGTPKLQALLASSPTRQPIPIAAAETAHIAWTVFVRYPVTLVSTLPRILYQAYHLHYDKRLAVYPRPEPKRRTEIDEQDNGTFNDPQVDEIRLGAPVGWQPISWTEQQARRILEQYIHGLPRSCGVIEIHFSDERPPVIRSGALSRLPVLRIDTEDPKFFSSLLASVTIDDWLLLAPERGTRVSNPALFERYFAGSTDGSAAPSHPYIVRMRRRYRNFFWRHSRIAPTPRLVCSTRSMIEPFAKQSDTLLVLFIISMSYALDVLEERIMSAIGARFVDLQAPWELWHRALAREYRTAGRSTSASDEPDDKADSLRSADSWVDLGSIRYA